ncbi:MAG: phosphatase PAP2 family protein [Nitrospiraceae bacterium]
MSWDVALFQAVNGLAGRAEWLDWLMFQLGRPKFLLMPALLAMGYWAWARKVEAAIGGPVLSATLGIGDLFGAQIKLLVERVRPCRVLSGVHELAGCGGTYSFPSNHALNTAAAAAFLQVLYPATGWVSWPLVAVIGFSRVYVGGHYVTDVLGGWTVGGLLGAGAALLLLRWPRFRAAPQSKPAPPAQTVTV